MWRAAGASEDCDAAGCGAFAADFLVTVVFGMVDTGPMCCGPREAGRWVRAWEAMHRPANVIV